MNKFLKRVKQEKKARPIVEIGEPSQESLKVLEEFHTHWSSLSEVRRKARRSFMYAYGDQWGDLIRDPDSGQMMTEGELIKKNGKVPLKNNMIAPILNNIDGQFRTINSKTVCAVRDQKESKVGEMMSVAIEYVHDINELSELDANTLKSALVAGFSPQRVEYGINPAMGNREDVWVYQTNPNRMFFNTNLEDVRMWDLTHIGEIMDIPLEEVISAFAHRPGDEEKIRHIYGDVDKALFLDYNAMQGDKNKNIDFFSSTQQDLCRVIFGWKRMTKDSYYYHDTMSGKWGYLDYAPEVKRAFDEENKSRIKEGLAMGMAEEDIPLIEYLFKVENYWKYFYLTPTGHVLQSGKSPYWHGEHNYVLGVPVFVWGQLLNYVEQFIDQQRTINRTATLIDFIRGTSSKGVLIVDDEAFEGMSREDIIDEYVRYNGVLFARLKPGQNIQNVVQQYNSGASVAGDFELLNLQLKLINEISGVNSAMQGQAPRSGTPSSLYAQQVQNSSLNLKGIFESYRAFRKRRDTKLMKMIQQFYTEERYINLAGVDYSEEAKRFDPKLVRAAEIDLVITDGNNTPAYQMVANDFLMELFRAQAIDVKTMLENTSYPFATKILEALKRKEQEMAEMQAGAPIEGVPMSPQMQMAMDNANAQPDDGLVKRA
jgi:hypothetical protein